MNRSVYSFLHFPAPDMTAGGYIVTDGQHQYGGYASTKRRGGLQYPSTCNAEGAGEPSPQQKKDRRFHGGSGMKRGSGTVVLLHMHYVGRSFRLLNPLYVRSCVFGAFFRQKISPYGNFLPETEGKTRRPAGTGELWWRGGNFSRSDGIIDFLFYLFWPTGQDFHTIVPMGIIAIPSWSEIFLLYWCFSN